MKASPGRFLNDLPVVFIDCQTTGPGPEDHHLLQFAWAAPDPGTSWREAAVHSFFVRLPRDARVPDRIQRITGITAEDCREGIEPRELARLVRPALQRCVPVAHYAVFEQRWLDALMEVFRPEWKMPSILCTRELARRIFPALPRKGIRAVAGFLGHDLSPCRRAQDHVRVTALIWNRLVMELTGRGIETLKQLRDLLDTPVEKHTGSLRYCVARDLRLALPDRPGIYRMLSAAGRVLYVGKAGSLRRRVNSYFTKRKGSEKVLELVTRVHDVSVTCCETPLEAALMEYDEIRLHRPAYNAAMAGEQKPLCRLSPVSSGTPGASGFGPLTEVSPALSMLSAAGIPGSCRDFRWNELGIDVEDADETVLNLGMELFRKEMTSGRSSMGRFQRLCLQLWLDLMAEREAGVLAEGTDEEDLPKEEGPLNAEDVLKRLRWHAAAGCRDLRTGAWLRLIRSCLILWRPFGGRERYLTMKDGKIHATEWIEDGKTADHPCGGNAAERMEPEEYGRLRVLSTEIRRIISRGNLAALHLQTGARLDPGKAAEVYAVL